MSEQTIEEAESEYKILLASKISAMKKEEEEKLLLAAQAELEIKQKADQEKLDGMVQERVEVIMEKYGMTPKVEDPIGDDANGEQNTNEVEVPKEFGFAQKYTTARGHNVFKAYENIAEDYVNMGVAAFTESDDGCVDTVDAWENVDYFADMIWMDVICKSDFLSKNITVKGLDFTQGNGGLVQIRVINHSDPSKDFGVAAPCTCLSCVSNTFSTYTLTMETYGDYKVLCDEDLFTAGDVIKTAIMKSMSSRAMERVDYAIYTELETAVPVYSESLTASATCTASRGTYGACCTFTVDLYNKIIDLEAAMRAGGYFSEADPVLIVSPTVAAFLKYKDGLEMPSYIAANIGMDGLKLAGIGNIKVIESCHANACTDVGAQEMAILIDPTRAIGEAWGKRPTFKVDDDPIECGSQKVVLRMWADFGALDLGAIGHIVNP